MQAVPLWKKLLKQNFSSIEKLMDYLELDSENRDKVLFKSSFILNLPIRLAEKIEKNTLDDPIGRQFIPLKEENEIGEDCKEDPVNDCTFQLSPKLLQKYQSRSLLVTTSACAMHCRYCFRRNYPYETKKNDFDFEIESIKKSFSQKEVILSGGDPLSLSNEKLRGLLKELEDIESIQIIRFHTRFPIGIPERIDDELIEILGGLSKKVVFILHTNHPKELDEELKLRLSLLSQKKIALLNQTVLLKGVNDSVNILEELSWKLIAFGVLPYYLHQLDPVKGGSHFKVTEEKGKEMISELKKRVPGYLVPKFVREIPGELSKTIIL